MNLERILFSGFIVTLIVIITTWLSKTFPFTNNTSSLINLFLWGCVVGLLLGVGIRDRLTWR